MLAYGARQLADAKAVVANLNDVETLGATSSINSDKTGTLTLNEMTVTALYTIGQHFTVEGSGYAKTGQDPAGGRHGRPGPDPARVRPVPGQRRDRVRHGRRDRRPDRGRARGARRQAGHRRGGEPPDATPASRRCRSTRPTSSWRPRTGCPGAATGRWSRWSRAVRTWSCSAARTRSPVRARPSRSRTCAPTSRRRWSGSPSRVCARSPSRRGSSRRPTRPPLIADPMSYVEELVFVGLVGIVDPLRPDRQGGRRDRPEGRHRGPHDHRRPRGDRERDRPAAGPRPGGDQRSRAGAASPTTSCWSGCRTCTCSAA